MNNIQIHGLSNGIQVVHRRVYQTEISHLGIMLDIGSRDEHLENQGIAHFWEHMAFKGTQKKSNLQIINRLEIVGGELNAYTTKEKICFHASILSPFVERAMELLSDITFFSNFPAKEIEKERGVILEEMAMYYDAPDDAIQDDFDELLFPNHPLGMNILGTEKTVASFETKDLQNFIEQHLDTSKIVLSSIGKTEHDKVFQWAEKHLGKLSSKRNPNQRLAPGPQSFGEKIVPRSMKQAHVAMGRQAFGIAHPDRLAFFMLINLLGGPGMNSRLNVSVRERQGLVYSIDAHFTSYLDSGFWAIYFGTEANQVQKALNIVHREMEKLKDQSLRPAQMNHIKTQLKGQLAMAEESNLNFMLMMAKNLLDKEKIENLEEIFQQIDAIDALKLQALAQEMFQREQLSYLIFEPQ